MKEFIHHHIPMRVANEFVKKHHRHHKPLKVGGIIAIGAFKDGKMVAVSIIGMPAAMNNDDGDTLECRRLCSDGTPNACSFLLRRSWNLTEDMGYKRLLTYTLNGEPGSSMKGASAKWLGYKGGGSWDRPGQVDEKQMAFDEEGNCSGHKKVRSREDKHPTDVKQCWEISTA